MGEECLEGFAEDDMFKALARLIGARVQVVTSNLKELIGLTRDGVSEDKSAFDLIEDKAIAILKESLSTDAFDKKKKEL